ncbi:MAG: carboxylating nicotinate-nucleotide diphosphorylase [Oscillospiraceae bacterium]|nr:carboxylating nicotinate-nucleotide diphosphorylase [Oscillospiraceae bacterium]
MKMINLGLDDFLISALKEDIGTGDITTESCVPASAVSHGFFKAKAEGVVCGVDVLRRVFALIDPAVKVTVLVEDGGRVKKGDIIAEIEGASRSILTGERVSLNLLQHMSGIATATAEASASVVGTKARIADTRKTTPGLRVLEKYAVKTGGGSNHRFNLSDGVLIKDNHIVAAGGIRNAVEAVRNNIPHTLKIEVETETMEQVKEALDAVADIIMLDNMTVPQMKEAVDFIAGRAKTEASGNMGERDLRQVAETGVDIISIGALTHTVRALDISLKFAE